MLQPNALLPGRTYSFVLTAKDVGGSAEAQVSFPVAEAPHGLAGPGTVGSLIVRTESPPPPGGQGAAADASSSNTSGGNELAGIAYTTAFTLSASGWAPPDPGDAFQYQFQCLITGVTDPNNPIVLSTFQPASTALGVTLPAGTDAAGQRVEVQLCVQLCAPTLPALCAYPLWLLLSAPAAAGTRGSECVSEFD